MYSQEFEAAFALVIGHEGGFTNDPKDHGNWTSGFVGSGACEGTKWGISAASYPLLSIQNISLDGAKLIYFNDFWTRVKGDDLPKYISSDIFDMAVNSGVHEAIVITQRACGVAQDGVIGPQTLAQLAAMSQKNLMKNITVERILVYSKMTTWTIFARSWVTRTIDSLVNSYGQ